MRLFDSKWGGFKLALAAYALVSAAVMSHNITAADNAKPDPMAKCEPVVGLFYIDEHGNIAEVYECQDQ